MGKQERIVVLPAGTSVFQQSTKEAKILLYIKQCPENIFLQVQSELKSHGIQTVEFWYGKFTKKDYFDALNTAKWVIYLQESESQGIALHEAWMHDVPTLVWNRQYWKYKDIIWYDEKISAPYLDDVCGLFFDETDFSQKLSLFLSQLWVYSPREYSLQNFTNSQTTKKLLQYLT